MALVSYSVPLTRFLSTTRFTPLENSSTVRGSGMVEHRGALCRRQRWEFKVSSRETWEEWWARLCQNSEPEGPHSKFWLWSLFAHHLFLLSHLAGLSQFHQSAGKAVKRAGLWAPFPRTERLSPALMAGCRGSCSAFLPASGTGLSSPCRQLNSVGNCGAVAAPYQSYLLFSSFMQHFGPKSRSKRNS